MIKYFASFVFLFLIAKTSISQEGKVNIKKASTGFTLQVNGKGFFIVGINWDYFPIGTNYKYSLWEQQIQGGLQNFKGRLRISQAIQGQCKNR